MFNQTDLKREPVHVCFFRPKAQALLNLMPSLAGERERDGSESTFIGDPEKGFFGFFGKPHLAALAEENTNQGQKGRPTKQKGKPGVPKGVLKKKSAESLWSQRQGAQRRPGSSRCAAAHASAPGLGLWSQAWGPPLGKTKKTSWWSKRVLQQRTKRNQPLTC